MLAYHLKSLSCSVLTSEWMTGSLSGWECTLTARSMHASLAIDNSLSKRQSRSACWPRLLSSHLIRSSVGDVCTRRFINQSIIITQFGLWYRQHSSHPLCTSSAIDYSSSLPFPVIHSLSNCTRPHAHPDSYGKSTEKKKPEPTEQSIIRLIMVFFVVAAAATVAVICRRQQNEIGVKMVASEQLDFAVSTEFLWGLQSLSGFCLTTMLEREEISFRRTPNIIKFKRNRELRRINVDKLCQIRLPFVIQASMMSRRARRNGISSELTRAEECGASGQRANDALNDC